MRAANAHACFVKTEQKHRLHFLHALSDIISTSDNSSPERPEPQGSKGRRKWKDSARPSSGARLGNITPALLPRFFRLRDAPSYLGMDKIASIAMCDLLYAPSRSACKGVAFDRVDLDTWADQYKNRNGRPAAQPKGESYGKPKNARAHRTRWSLAHRQDVPRSAHLRKHWNEQPSASRRSISPSPDSELPRDETVRRTASAHVSGSCNQVPGGASTQAKSRTRCEGPGDLGSASSANYRCSVCTTTRSQPFVQVHGSTAGHQSGHHQPRLGGGAAHFETLRAALARRIGSAVARHAHR